MPDVRRHRGPHPEDEAGFAPAVHAILREAVDDLSWLLTRGYAPASALELVGNRFQLRERQRQAVMRSACSDEALRRRRERRRPLEACRGVPVLIDGFNLLTTIEAALAGGVLLRGRDGCCRDMASMHGSYRKVAETLPALRHIGEVLAPFAPSRCVWYLDRPVSNSGRLAKIVRELAEAEGWPWEVELVDDPDAILVVATDLVVSADSRILDGAVQHLDLAGEVVRRLPMARPIELGSAP